MYQTVRMSSLLMLNAHSVCCCTYYGKKIDCFQVFFLINIEAEVLGSDNVFGVTLGFTFKLYFYALIIWKLLNIFCRQDTKQLLAMQNVWGFHYFVGEFKDLPGKPFKQEAFGII